MEFHRRIRITKGVYINLSKHGIGFSVGTKGLHYSVGPSGSHITAGIPGTGLYYRRRLGEHKARDQPKDEQTADSPARSVRHAAADTDVGQEVPMASLLASGSEKLFRKGCAAYQLGDYAQAYTDFEELTVSGEYAGDANLMAGLTASYTGDYGKAIDFLSNVLELDESPLPGEEGSLIARYLPQAAVKAPVTQFAVAELPIGLALATFLLVELLRMESRPDEAITLLEDVLAEVPDYRLLHLALADLYCLVERYDDLFQLLSEHEHHLENEDDITLELMYYWAVALTVKEMFDAADDVYHRALTKSKERNPELVKVVQYGRADMYERWGKKAEARKLFEKLYAYDPQFYDVTERVAALHEET